jgi:hypothetical protein
VGHFERQWWVIISDIAWVTLCDNVGHLKRNFASKPLPKPNTAVLVAEWLDGSIHTLVKKRS